MKSPSVLLTLLASTASLLPSSDAFGPLQVPSKFSTCLQSNVVSAFMTSPSEPNDAVPNNPYQEQKKQTLTRPERKALERQKKHRKATEPKIKASNYKLHSTNVAQLTQESTAEDVVKAIKRAQNMHDHHDIRVIVDFLLDDCDPGFAYGYRGSLLARLAVAAMHLGDNESAQRAIEARRVHHRPAMLPMESAAIIRGLLRVHNTTDALAILDDELSLPLDGLALSTEENKDLLKHRALSLASIASRHFFEGKPSMAVKACQMMTELGPILRSATLTAEEISMPWQRIINGAAQCESGRRDGSITPCKGLEDMELPCNLVYSVLNAMTTFPSENSDRVFEALSNALVRRCLFVTGAVAMSGCPPADRGEAVFIGRSNVGKSSLVNMITNRKSLAYISKRPGKTQQFNYFTVNDKPGREKEFRYGDDVKGQADPDSFYIVDLPGFGFAKVPEQQRKEWADFMTEYLAKRRTLRVVFHLVDGRHGPIDEDARIMKQVSESLPKNVAYVVVLTKADKNVKGSSKKNPGKVSKDVQNSLRETMKANGVGNVPVILTSAETNLGRDDMWRFLRLAAEA